MKLTVDAVHFFGECNANILISKLGKHSLEVLFRPSEVWCWSGKLMYSEIYCTFFERCETLELCNFSIEF